MEKVDVAIIGGGIIGTSAAAYLAEGGRSVVLIERAELAAGASGRNSGIIQHPFDAPYVDLHRASIALYRDLSLADDGFELPALHAGLLLVSFDPNAILRAAATIDAAWPALAPSVLPPGEASALEPALNQGVAACRLETGYAVAPSAATLAFARRASRAGARLIIGSEAKPIIAMNRVNGVQLADGESIACEEVLVAAGPWTPSLIPGWDDIPFIRSVWGAVVSTSLPAPPVHVLEELGIDTLDVAEGRLFSLVSVGPSSSVGSTFLDDEPDPLNLAPEIMNRARAFVPTLSRAEILSVRACARPVTIDGRPVVGAVVGIDGLFVCAGHGPWGISTGPASSRLVADQMLGLASERDDLSPARLGGVTS